MKGLVVDNFAGGGGASLGIEQAIGRPIDLAVNHSATALAMHAANHPATIHRCESVWSVDPVEACSGRPVALAWFSPDCRQEDETVSVWQEDVPSELAEKTQDPPRKKPALRLLKGGAA